MTTWKDWIVIIIGMFVCLLILLSLAECTITFAVTDIDCWLANDPIICQKIKENK